jgi:hypothetical protein
MLSLPNIISKLGQNYQPYSFVTNNLPKNEQIITVARKRSRLTITSFTMTQEGPCSPTLLKLNSNLLPLLGNEVGEIDDPLGVSPLVVIPCYNLNHVVSHNHGE